MYRGKELRVLYILCSAHLMVVPWLTSAQPTAKKNVLILNSYRVGYEWTDDQVRGIQAALKDEPYETELWVEYMDAVRFSGAGHLENLKRLYSQKYLDKKFDLVITTDDAALSFLLAHRAELFGNAPVVFCGVNDLDRSRLKDQERITGIFEVFSTETILSFSLGFHPDTRRVYVVTENGPIGDAVRTSLESELRKRSGMETVFLDGRVLTLEEIIGRLAASPPRSLVILSVFRHDKTGTYYRESESHARLARGACQRF